MKLIHVNFNYLPVVKCRYVLSKLLDLVKTEGTILMTWLWWLEERLANLEFLNMNYDYDSVWFLHIILLSRLLARNEVLILAKFNYKCLALLKRFVSFHNLLRLRSIQWHPSSQVTVSLDDTIILDGGGDKQRIEERCQQVLRIVTFWLIRCQEDLDNTRKKLFQLELHCSDDLDSLENQLTQALLYLTKKRPKSVYQSYLEVLLSSRFVKILESDVCVKFLFQSSSVCPCKL